MKIIQAACTGCQKYIREEGFMLEEVKERVDREKELIAGALKEIGYVVSGHVSVNYYHDGECFITLNLKKKEQGGGE